MNRAIAQPNASDPLALAQATAAIDPPQPSDLADCGPAAKVSMSEISPRISKRIS
jgi:hypothetical protein